MRIHRPVLVDTREQTPWFQRSPVDGIQFKSQRATLATADYTLLGLEAEVLVERKNVSDLVGSVGRGRERFERELARMRETTRSAWLVVEGTPRDVELECLRRAPPRGRAMSPRAVIGSLLAWAHRIGLRVWWAGSADAAEAHVARLFAAVERTVSRTSAAAGLGVCGRRETDAGVAES